MQGRSSSSLHSPFSSPFFSARSPPFSFLSPASCTIYVAYDSSPEQLESSLAIFIVTFLLWQVQHLRKKLTELEEKQAVGEKEACKGEEDLAHLEEELLVKLKETTNMKGKRKPLSVMLEKEEKK